MSALLHAEATTARLDAAISASPPHLRPLLLAVRDHRVAMLYVSQDAGPFAIPADVKRPALVMVGDDMETSVGPSRFHVPSLRRAMRACVAFTVVTSAPTVEVYALGTAPTIGGKNAMIIETRLEHELEWLALIQKTAPGRPVLLSTVKGGTA